MNKSTVIIAAAALVIGLLLGRSFVPQTHTAMPAETELEILYWDQPKDPN